MNRSLLIDGIVRQVMVLIAQLATTGGSRTPLAHVAGEVFLGLAAELEEQGLGRKVIADMFGITLRAYHGKVRRLAESRTVRGQSLWTAVVEFIGEAGPVTRGDIEARFVRDDAASVAGILNDLCRSSVLFRSGSGAGTVYRLATSDDFGASGDSDRADSILWLEVFRSGPVTQKDLQDSLPALPEAEIEAGLLRLEEAGRVARTVAGGRALYRSAQFVIPLEESAGWEAAVLDHFRTATATIAAKLSEPTARLSDDIGGSTYHFDLWPGHPLEDIVAAEFRRMRTELSELRARVDDDNARSGVEPSYRLSLYLGQLVVRDSDDTEEEPA